MDLNPTDYWRFFDRQFPRFVGGVAVPSRIRVHDGRRPRVITGQQTRGTLVLSKTIDTCFKRLEIHWPAALGATCAVNGYEATGREWSDPATGEKLRSLALDVHVPKGDRFLRLALDGENAVFHVNNLMFVENEVPTVQTRLGELTVSEGYSNVEKLVSFFD